MNPKQTLEEVSKVKALYEKQLMKLPNVVGVGVGFKQKNGQPTDEIALIVNVSEKKPQADLSTQALVPSELDGVTVDVQEVGKFSAW
jgi:hypothetical protein